MGPTPQRNALMDPRPYATDLAGMSDAAFAALIKAREAAMPLSAKIERTRARMAEEYSPTKGMSPLALALAGVGKGMSAPIQAVQQATGRINRADVDEMRRRDAPLMDTFAGTAGNLLGGAATSAPLMAMPGANALMGGMVYNGLLGAAQPVGTGDSVIANAALGAAPMGPMGSSPARRDIFIGDKAKTWDRAAAARAEALEKAGADPRAIWKETGTFRGVDGKLRQEIDDSAAKWEPWFEASPPGVAINTAVGDALDHPALFKAYPQSPNIGLGMYPGSHNAAFQPAANTAFLPNRGESGRSMLLHELQHAIQEQQGFARGGAPESMRDEALRMLRRDVGSGEIESTERAMSMLPMYQENAYRRLAGEAEARAVQARMNMTPAQRRAMFPLDSYDVPVKSLIVR